MRRKNGRFSSFSPLCFLEQHLDVLLILRRISRLGHHQRTMVLLQFAERHDRHILARLLAPAALIYRDIRVGILRHLSRHAICLEARLRGFDFERTVFCFLGLGAASLRKAWNSATASRESHGLISERFTGPLARTV